MNTRIKRAAVVWACAGVLLLAWSGLAAGANAGQDDKYDDQVAAAQRQQQFWKIVAGEQGAPPGVFGKLANDLHEIPLYELGSFRGDSNRYGGITDELGYDPFNGENCSECGPLDIAVQNNVVAARDGSLTSVLAALEPEEPNKTEGPPGWTYLLWLLSGPAMVGGIYALEQRRRARRYAEFGAEMALIENIDEALPQLNPASDDYSELLSLKRHMQSTIDERIRYGEESARAMKLAELRREAEDTLEALSVGNRELR